MFGYRRASFRRAVALLASIRDEPGNVEAIYELQKLLIAEVTLAEGRVRDSKGLAKNDAMRRSRFEARARAHRQSIYYWKAFGDAIAFLHCDRFALKHVYYNTDNLGVKQDGGFISGAAGFEQELEALRGVLDAGIPGVLCDLTNTIRYGDVCLLAGNDPVVVEVKSSATRDRRRSRQIRRLKTLREFYENDIAHGLRGLGTVFRVETRSEPRSFEHEFNACIEAAYERGYAVIGPEPGVRYVAVTGDVEEGKVFREVDLEEPWLFSLNEAKMERGWSPYYPFALLIRSERALYDFLLGRLLLFVVLDVAVMKELAQSMGWTTVEVDAEADYSLQVARNRGKEKAGLAKSALARAAFEAVSLRWLVEEGLGGFEAVVDELAGDEIAEKPEGLAPSVDVVCALSQGLLERGKRSAAE